MPADHNGQYRAYVREKLRELTPVFALAAVGDFSRNVELPDQDDEFADLAVGVQVMIEVIRQQLGELRELNQSLEKRVAERTAALNEAQSLAHIGSWEWDRASDTVHCSSELYRIFGLSPQTASITYKSFLERVDSADRKLVRRTLDAAWNDGRPFAIDHRIVRPDGSVCVVSTRGEKIVDGGRTPTGMIGTCQDITERERIAEALRESEEKYRNLVETARDVIFAIDREGKITSLNSAFEAVTGWKRSEWIGKSFLGLLHPDDRKDAEGRIRQLIDGMILPPHEWRILSGRGGLLTGEITSAPLIRSGRVTGVLGIARDISERKRIERQVLMLAHTLRSMNEVVIITDLSDRIVFVNRAFVKTYGYDEAEVIGKTLDILRPENSPPNLSDEIRRSTIDGGWKGELTNRRKNGERFPILLSTSTIFDDHGAPVSLVGIARDITTEKDLQRRLDHIARQHTEHLRLFASSVQRAQEDERRRIARELHDGLGQLLTGMKFDIEVFEDTIPKNQTRTRRQLRLTKRRIDGLITEIRRISSNLHPSALDDFGLQVALGLLAREFERDHRIAVTFAAGDGQFTHDDPQVGIALYRIAQEALSNIARHALATAVEIGLSRDGNSVSLSIRDNGKGFDPSTPPQRGNHVRGLGLISMQERTEQLGGSFSIRSSREAGTSLHIRIPVHP